MNVWLKLRALATRLPLLYRAFVLIRGAAPGWSAAWGVVLVCLGLLPVANVYLTRELVDSLVALLGRAGGGADWSGARPVLGLVALMAAVTLLIEALGGALKVIRAAQAQLVRDHVSALIQEKSVELDLSFYESADYYDKLHRARHEAAQRPLEMVESLGDLARNGITLAAMASVLLAYGPWAPAALLLGTLPILSLVLKHRRIFYHWRLRNTAGERRAWYYELLLTDRESAAEARVFGLAPYFRAAFGRLRAGLNREALALEKSRVASELGAGLLSLLITGAAMGWMVWRVVAGAVSLGDLALFYQAFQQGQKLLRSLLENIGQIYGSSLFLHDFFEFLALKPAISDPAEPVRLSGNLRQGVRFENVTFGYGRDGRDGGGERPALERFSLTLPAGSITAIVGANGAGKSTLVKLLCRFYDPLAGAITFDGVDIRRLKVRELRDMITVLFQQPVRYEASAADNILLGDLGLRGGGQERIVEAARLAGADGFISRLPEGYETPIGRWFAGAIDLSGGEWQRIALARAFLRRAPLIILDEPTSAMDSWSEMEWLKRFRRLAEGRTALIIAHRFTTAMQADMIHVMDRGRIVESGRHEELLASGGRYAASWREQMREEGGRGRNG